ncbi:MAG TPA: FAD-dependent oxidoreductase [Symbiobacteriaceae bacterium]
MADRVPTFDVAVVGGGIVGCAIAHRLSRHTRSLVLLERAPDVCEGTSKANSGIVHTGFDAKPGTLEARLLGVARRLWPTLAEELGIPLIRTGAVMVARSPADMDYIQNTLVPGAAANGVEVRVLTREEVLQLAPHVTDRAVGGLHIPGESLTDPFWATRAFAEAAARNGAEIWTENGAEAMEIVDGGTAIRIRTTGGRELKARKVINAAGLWSDEVARLIGDTSFRLTPRKGQFLLSEDDLGIQVITLPVPNPKSKGILVTPLAIGGLLMGPTAEDQEDKTDFATTREGLARVLEETSQLVPAVAKVKPVRAFAGLRAVYAGGDYIIRPSEVTPLMLHVAGIRSTGVSASPGIAAYVAELLQKEGFLPPERTDLPPRPEWAAEEGSSEVVCLCRNITRGEIERALSGPIPIRSLDAVKRRTGAMLGECQGNQCMVRIMQIMTEKLGIKPTEIIKHAAGSYVAVAPGEER